MGTLPIKCSGDVVRITLQKGSVGRNRAQADDPGAAHGSGANPTATPAFRRRSLKITLAAGFGERDWLVLTTLE
jgi:hypothetical protein